MKFSLLGLQSGNMWMILGKNNYIKYLNSFKDKDQVILKNNYLWLKVVYGEDENKTTTKPQVF